MANVESSSSFFNWIKEVYKEIRELRDEDNQCQKDRDAIKVLINKIEKDVKDDNNELRIAFEKFETKIDTRYKIQQRIITIVLSIMGLALTLTLIFK